MSLRTLITQAVFASLPPKEVGIEKFRIRDDVEKLCEERTGAVVVDSEFGVGISVLVGSCEGLVNEGKVADESGVAAVRGDGGPGLFVLHALQGSHAVRGVITDNFVDDIPRGYRRAHTLDFLLDMLRNDVVDEITRRHTSGKPRLNTMANQYHEWMDETTPKIDSLEFESARKCCGHGKSCHSWSRSSGRLDTL